MAQVPGSNLKYGAAREKSSRGAEDSLIPMPVDDSQYNAKVRGYTQGQVAFGRFALIRMVGRGGMGVVWHAWDNRLERDVALKFLPEKLRLDEKAVEDLRRETRRCLSLTHPNIVRTYDFHVDEQTAAMAMEFVDGETLSTLRMKQPGQIFMPSQLMEWLKQVNDALTYAYRHEEVVHLDLKPANVMVDQRGQVKITDFGIASTVTDSLQRMSPDEELCGSPPYMSPQQIMGDPPSVSDDIYSLGVTIYEMLTGKPPYHGEKILQQVLHGTPAPITDRRLELLKARNQVAAIPQLEEIPARWEEVIIKCLAKHPTGRPGSISELVEGLLPPKPRVRLPQSKTSARFTPEQLAARAAHEMPAGYEKPAAESAPSALPATQLVDQPVAPEKLAPAHPLRRWLWILVLILALAVFFWAGITAVFS
jgi:serine/threonine protein kinase